MTPATAKWGIAPGISQPIDPAPLRLPLAPQWGYKTFRQMPPASWLLKGTYYGVPFTFNDVAARGTAQVNVQFAFDVQAWGWTAHSTDTSGSAGAAATYDVLILHLLPNGDQRVWTPRRVCNLNIFGTATFPMWLKVPQVILAGESLQMEVASSSAVEVTQIQALLHCTRIMEK